MQRIRINFFRLSLITLFLLNPLAMSPVGAGELLPLTGSSLLDELMAEGLANNQKLRSQQSKFQARYDEVESAGVLDDPRLGVAFLNLPTDTFDFDQEPMTQKQVSIAQRFPWFGKLDLKTQRALLEAKKEETKWQALRLGLARRIASSYYELVLVTRSHQVNTQLIELLNQLLQSSESRYASGRGLQQDVLQAQVQLSRLADERHQLEARRSTVNSRINEMLNRPDFQEISARTELQLPDLAIDRGAVKERALNENPNIRILALNREQNAVAVSLARKAFYPDFDARLAYGFRENDQQGNDRADFFSIGLNLNIPLWQKKKQKPRLEAAIKRRNAADQSLRELRLSLPHKIDVIIHAIDQLKASHNLYVNTLLLQARQWAESAQSAYEVGKLEFNTLINTRVQVLRLELQADAYKYRIYQKRAELEELIGAPL